MASEISSNGSSLARFDGNGDYAARLIVRTACGFVRRHPIVTSLAIGAIALRRFYEQYPTVETRCNLVHRISTDIEEALGNISIWLSNDLDS